MEFFKVTSEIADDFLGLAGWVLKKLDASGRVHRKEEVLGCSAEVSVGIMPGGTGEIVVIGNGSLQHYPAKCADLSIGFPRGSKVRIADVGANVMFVESFQTNETVEPVSEVSSAELQPVEEVPETTI